MSVEQWVVLALLVLLPLLEGVTRFRRARASNGDGRDSVGEARTSQRRLSLPSQDQDDTVVRTKQVVSPPPSSPPSLTPLGTAPAISASGGAARYASTVKGSASVGAHTKTGRTVTGDAVVPWIRPVRNLRRAIVMATILGPPPQ